MVEASLQSLKQTAKELDQRKAAAERRLQAIAAELDGLPGKPGLSGKLTDDEV